MPRPSFVRPLGPRSRTRHSSGALRVFASRAIGRNRFERQINYENISEARQSGALKARPSTQRRCSRQGVGLNGQVARAPFHFPLGEARTKGHLAIVIAPAIVTPGRAIRHEAAACARGTLRERRSAPAGRPSVADDTAPLIHLSSPLSVWARVFICLPPCGRGSCFPRMAFVEPPLDPPPVESTAGRRPSGAARRFSPS